ncbi:hypothetical protein NB713_002930 [Xanthomonas sacchari]|nr:hypothetical protein [Xanthomonas sacchari]
MAPVVVGLEILRRADRPGQEAAAQRRVRHEADAQLAHRLQHAVVFRIARPQRVLALQRGDRMHRVRAADGGRGGFGQAEEAHLALFHQPRHRPDRVLDRHVRIHPVLVVEVDVVHAEPAQAGLAGRLHVFRTAVDAACGRVVGVELDAELGRQHDLVAAPGQRLADQHFVGVRAVHVGGVDEADAVLDRGMDDRDRGGVVAAAAVERAHAHAAEAEGGDAGAVAAEGAGLHGDAPEGEGRESVAAGRFAQGEDVPSASRATARALSAEGKPT